MQDHLNREQIARYCNRQSASEELGLLDEHLAECADCRERLFSAARLREALQRAPSRDQSPPGQTSASHSRQSGEEHLSYEQLEAFIDEESSPGEKQLVLGHTETCRKCAEDLHDLRTFKMELSYLPAAGTQNKKNWWTTRFATIFAVRPVFVAAASAVIVLVAVIGITTLRGPGPRPPNTEQTANFDATKSSPSAAQHSAGSTSASATVQKEALQAFAQLEGSATVQALQADEQEEVLQAFALLENAIPNPLSEVQGKHQTLLGKPILTPAFEVVEPVGEVVWEVRPRFRWKPMSRAINYSVALFEANLNPVQESGKLQDVQWVPSRDLIRGRVYQWQVTAHLQDGSSVNAPAPPQPEARFRVLDREKEEELSRFASAHPEAHLALGILDGRAGLLSKAEQQFKQISETDADYKLAQGLLKRILEIRRSAN